MTAPFISFCSSFEIESCLDSKDQKRGANSSCQAKRSSEPFSSSSSWSSCLMIPPGSVLLFKIFLSISEEERKKFSEVLGKIDASAFKLEDLEFSEEPTAGQKEEEFEKQKSRKRMYMQLWQDTGGAKIPGLLSYISHLLENPEGGVLFVFFLSILFFHFVCLFFFFFFSALAAGGRTKFLVFAYHTNVLEAVSKLLGLLVRFSQLFCCDCYFSASEKNSFTTHIVHRLHPD